MTERSDFRPEGFRFAHRIRVRWAEVDLQKVVFFGHYYAYFDLGMTEYFRHLGTPYPEGFVDAETDLFMAHSECDYHASAFYDDVLDLWARVARIGRSSLHFECAVHRGEERLVTGRLVYVFANPMTRRSTSVPQPIRKAIESFDHPDDKS